MSVDRDNVGVAVAAACVTLIVCGVTPYPLTVMVAVRWLVVELFAAVTVIVPLSYPELGDMLHHEASLLIFQLVLDVIVNVFCSPAAIKFNED